MKKGQLAEGIIEKVDFPNKGVVYIEDGEKVIVKNGLPGQKVQFVINKKRKGKCEGRLLEVLEKSQLELDEPSCVHFGNCGGCMYLTLSYTEQLKLKETQVRELLGPQLSACFEGIKPSPKQFAYRNKMEFSFGDEYKDGPLALGMHKRGSFYDLVTVDQCRIVHSDYNQILSRVLAYFSKAEVSYFKKKSHEGYLRHLLVRRAEKTGEILVDLVTTTQSCGKKEETQLLREFCDVLLQLKLQGKIVGVLHTRNDSLSDAVKDEGTEVLYGQDFFYEELSGLKFRITPFSFFQTNSLGAEVLYETARAFISSLEKGRSSVVFDLYSGTGTIAQMISPSAGKVIGVEIVEEAVAAAKENAKLNGLANCEFIAGDVLQVLDQIKERPDFIIVDPPREGIHPKALRKIGRDFGVPEMIYISCNPVSLARDLEMLAEYGYRVQRVCCVDMFPGTVHVESIVKLVRK